MADWSNIYGMGRGAAQVWGANPALEQLERQNYEEQKRREKNVQDLAADASKINFDGAKREDIPELSDRLKGIKSTLAKIRAARNNDERITLQTQYEDQKADFSSKLYESKNEVKTEGEIFKIGLNKPNDVSDTFYDDVKKWRSLSTFDPKKKELGDKLVKTMYRPKFDEIGFINKVLPLVGDKVKGDELHERRVGDATQFYRTEGEQFNPQTFKNLIVREVTNNNRELVNFLKTTYPDVPLSQAIDSYAVERGRELASRFTTKDVNVRMDEDEKPAQLTPWQIYQINKDLNGGSGGAEAPQDIPLYYGEDGQASTTGRGVVKIPIPAKNFVGSYGIDLSTGQPIKLTRSSNDYEVVSVGNYPILKRDVTLKHKNGKTETLKAGALVQDDFAEANPNSIQLKPFIHVQEKSGNYTKDRLIDYKYMVKGLTKKQEEVLSTFRPAQGQPIQSAPKTTSSKTTVKSSSGIKWK